MSRTRVEHVEGMEMYCALHGEGPPLVLLHGFTGSSADWQPMLAGLGAGAQAIVPDLRGHGRSTNPSGAFTFRQCARDVLALLDRLGVERFRAVGLSGGGNTLLHVATAAPARVESMVLVSATTHYGPEARAFMSAFTVETRSDEEWRFMRRSHHHGDEQIRALWAQGHAFADSHDDVCFGAVDLARIQALTLVVSGHRDPLYPVSIACALRAAIPRAWLWVVPGGGHVPVFGAEAGRFVETSAAFLRGDPPF